MSNSIAGSGTFYSLDNPRASEGARKDKNPVVTSSSAKHFPFRLQVKHPELNLTMMEWSDLTVITGHMSRSSTGFYHG